MPDTILNISSDGQSALRRKKAENTVNLGLGFNAVLAVVKVFSGIAGHSQALLADGINSVSDVIYFIVIKIFVKLAGAPPDSEHPYGHHQYESIAALVVGAFVITTGAAIFWDSVNAGFEMLNSDTAQKGIPWFALYAAGATIIVKIFLMMNALVTAKKTGNLAISALASDHKNDIFSSVGVTAGIIGSMAGFPWLDPLAGALVAVIVAKTGFGILREASSDLMDNVPTMELENQIKTSLAKIPEIIKVEEIHAHRFGPYLVANLTICIDGKISVFEGDRIADSAEHALLNRIDMLRKVYVHYHPCRQVLPAP